MTWFGFERPPRLTGSIDFSVYEYPTWQRRLLGLVRGVLAKRTYEDPENTGDDPADDEEMWDQLLLTLYPPDGKDRPRT